MLPLPQYGSVAQLISSGKADIGLGFSDQILGWDSNGLPLIAVAVTMQHDPQAIMGHKNSPIRDFKDLEGHTISAQTGPTWLRYVISRCGLHNVRQVPSTLSIVSLLADPSYVQQIFVTSEPFFAKQAGAEVFTLLISSSGFDPHCVQFTTRDFAAQHPHVVAKFVRASIRGWQEYLCNPGPADAPLLQLKPALNPQQEASAAQALRDGGSVSGAAAAPDHTGQMNASRWQTSCGRLKSLGILCAPVDGASA